jgi:uncharacterized protein DUF4404
MNDQRIRLGQLVGELRSQLASSDTVDADLRRRLEQTLAEVQNALAAPTGQGPAGEPLGKRLSEATLEFETSHPALAGTLSSIIDALGRMGI